MLFISITLRKAVLLWLRHFWVLMAITLLANLPFLLLDYIMPPRLSPSSHALGLALLLALFLRLFFLAAKTAAILGLLIGDPTESRWHRIVDSLEENTWTFVRLFLLLSIFTALLTLILLALLRSVHAPYFFVLPLTILYLIFIKCALANPLVVAERWQAWDALKRSWSMTRGCFMYVAGCYLIVAGVEGTINWFMPKTVAGTNLLSFLLTHAFHILFDPLWLTLAWSMYLEIKTKLEADGGSAPQEFSEN
jgi:hypothetical protein